MSDKQEPELYPVEQDTIGYEDYEEDENGVLIRELEIPDEMVIDTTRVKGVALKSDVLRNVLVLLACGAVLLLVMGVFVYLGAMPYKADSFWSVIVHRHMHDRGWDAGLLNTAKWLVVWVSPLVLGALLLMFLSKRRTTALLFLLLGAEALSLLFLILIAGTAAQIL